MRILQTSAIWLYQLKFVDYAKMSLDNLIVSRSHITCFRQFDCATNGTTVHFSNGSQCDDVTYTADSLTKWIVRVDPF